MTPKYVSKTEQETLNNMDIVTDVEKNNLPGKGGSTFKMQLDRDWLGKGDLNDTKQLMIVSKPKSPMYQRILSWITFGLYKPTSFSYEVKEINQ